ncbi:MAG: hypothetical protein M3063_07975 [Actinomycetota bacterium]|nr:hypothetical protein [Actinomycetota bacterium]
MAATRLGVERRSTKGLGPVARQVFDVLGMTWMRERILPERVARPAVPHSTRPEWMIAAWANGLL